MLSLLINIKALFKTSAEVVFFHEQTILSRGISLNCTKSALLPIRPGMLEPKFADIVKPIQNELSFGIENAF